MQSLDGTQLWCPGQSLWSLITEHVPGFELPKIHTALGYSLVDMYTEVHTEAEMWHKMWQESQHGNSSSRAGTPLPRQQASLLADPPAVKELVRAEVKMLLQTLRERAGGEGRAAEELIFRYKPETVDYALSHLDSCDRNPGDTESGSRPSSRCSVQSNAEDEIQAMRDKLNVADIDQVVDRLRSFLMEECEALNRLVKHFKGNIKQRWQSPCEVDKLEPSLAELRELRGAIQMDLELYPSSLAASPTASFPLKELKSRFRLSAGQKVSDETLRSLSRTSVFRPHPPPPPVSHPKQRPPASAPPSRASASVKAIHSSSLSRIYGQHRSTSASSGPRKTQAPICNGITASVHANRQFTTSLPGPDSDNMIVHTVHRCMLSPEQDSAALRCRPPTSCPSLQAKTQRNSPIREPPLSSHRSIHGSGRECDLSQMGRKSSPFWRSRNINAVPSSPRCDAGSYSSNSTDHSVSTTGTRNGRRDSTCGSSSVSTTVQTDGDRSSPLGKDVTHHQSLVATCTHPAPVTMNGQFFTSPKRPLESVTSQAKGLQETELEFKFHQPVPPPRVST